MDNLLKNSIACDVEEVFDGGWLPEAFVVAPFGWCIRGNQQTLVAPGPAFPDNGIGYAVDQKDSKT
jgi:hypothetical protein